MQPNMRILISIILLSICFDGLLGQNNLELMNEKNQRTKTIRLDSRVSISLNISREGDYEYVSRFYGGYLVGITGDSLFILMENQQFEMNGESGGRSKINDYWGEESIEKGFPIDDILWIEHERKLYGISAGIATLGLIATTVAAPLASIDYKEGEIKSDLYFGIAGAGLATAVLGYTLAFGPGARKYYLCDVCSDKKKIWKIINE